MNAQRFAVVVTVVNLVLLVVLLAQLSPAAAQGVVPVLRGRGLEIVDDRGRVRASIGVMEETVLLRLIDRDQRPAVKLSASEQGSGILLMGVGQGTYVQLGAKDTVSSLRLLNRDGREQVLKP